MAAVWRVKLVRLSGPLIFQSSLSKSPQRAKYASAKTKKKRMRITVVQNGYWAAKVSMVMVVIQGQV